MKGARDESFPRNREKWGFIWGRQGCSRATEQIVCGPRNQKKRKIPMGYRLSTGRNGAQGEKLSSHHQLQGDSFGSSISGECFRSF